MVLLCYGSKMLLFGEQKLEKNEYTVVDVG
jgi:hypothetical protein